MGYNYVIAVGSKCSWWVVCFLVQKKKIMSWLKTKRILVLFFDYNYIFIRKLMPVDKWQSVKSFRELWRVRGTLCLGKTCNMEKLDLMLLVHSYLIKFHSLVILFTVLLGPTFNRLFLLPKLQKLSWKNVEKQ